MSKEPLKLSDERSNNMNKSEMRQGHVELWTWLSENPDKEKSEWPEWDNKYECNENLCFACEVAKNGEDELDAYIHCKHCPIKWSGDCGYGARCLSAEAEYYEWSEKLLSKKQQRERAELAKKIAGMWPEEG